MYAIVLKYLQLVCFAVLFDQISCDQLQMGNMNDDKLTSQTIACTAMCLRDRQETVSDEIVSMLTNIEWLILILYIRTEQLLERCYRECSDGKIADLPSVTQKSSNETIQLICRESDSMVIRILTVIEEDADDVLYLLRFHENTTGIIPKNYYIVRHFTQLHITCTQSFMENQFFASVEFLIHPN